MRPRCSCRISFADAEARGSHYTATRGDSNENANTTVSDAAAIVHEKWRHLRPGARRWPARVFSIDQRDLLALKSNPNIQAVEVVDQASVKPTERQGWVALLGE